jgi:putative SOS response-associated peptidase YedK
MKRFHKPGEEKRSLVIMQPEDFDDWLACRSPEMARAYLQLFPAERMVAQQVAKPAPKKLVKPKEKIIVPQNLDLFD